MTLLLLAGTAEARALAAQIAQAGGAAVASLAGTGRPAALDLPTRVGGFGGAAGFARYLETAGITAILDATHPFAARISARTAAMARERALPYLQLLRPEWRAGSGDRWTPVATPEDAAALIPAGATVFLATGRSEIGRFAGLAGRRVYCRQLSEPDTAFPFAGGRYLVGRPPFAEADEAELFARLGIDWLVARNAGGAASRAKLDAARALGIRVAMIARPAQPDVPRVATVAAAMDWVTGP